METAIKWIVDQHVQLQNRQALEDLRAHRQRLLADLKSRSGSVYDLRAPIQQLDAEIAVIDHGLETLAALPLRPMFCLGAGIKKTINRRIAPETRSELSGAGFKYCATDTPLGN